jgi:hypothetical protein
MKFLFRLMILALAGFGGYTLWERFGPDVRSRFASGDSSGPTGHTVFERSELTVTEWADEPASQTAVLTDSDDESLPSR